MPNAYRAVYRIQDQDDGPGILSSGDNGLYVRWNNGTGHFEMASAGSSYTAGTGLTLTGTVFSLTNPVTIALGGTGQTTATAAFDALSPLTTQGDILYRNATTNVRLGTGTAGGGA